MRIFVVILTVLVVVCLSASAPVYAGALSGPAATIDASSDGHDMSQGASAPMESCPGGHCPDGGAGHPDCAAGLGSCGAAFLALVPALPSIGGASDRLPFAQAPALTVGSLRDEPPPPRAPILTV